MAILLSIKVILLSTSVLSMAMILKHSVTVITEFAHSELPSKWSLVTSWLRPPYLYIVVNCIIITIVASSRLQSKVDDWLSATPETHATLLPTEPVKVATGDVREIDTVVYESVVPRSEAVELTAEKKIQQLESSFTEFVKVSEPELFGDGEARVSDMKSDSVEEINVGNEFVNSKSPWTAAFPAEKPPVSARFGHRKSVKSNSEGGRTLGVSKPKRQDTLESTWKMITDGRSMPLTRHLRKSDTWETAHHHHQEPPHEQDQRMTKSETFNVNHHNKNSNNTLSRSTGSGKLRKEPSLGQDELNKRVEAFIKKFNDDMRLQRQESLNQYIKTINRGAH